MKPIHALLALLLLSACTKSDRTFVAIGTGSETGVYFPVGGAIKTIIEHDPASRLRISVAATEGSVANINAVVNGQREFGIAQADRQYQAVHGLGVWEGRPQDKLRSVFALHHEIVTLVASEDSGIRRLEDLRGKTVNIGNPGSGQRGNALDIFRTLGMDPDTDFNAETLTAAECAGMLQDGRIDAYFYTVGHPNGSITEVSNNPKRRVRFVPITGMEALLAATPYYSVTEVPVTLYPKAIQEGPVPSIGMVTTFVTSADVPEDVVYELTKAVLTGLDAFKATHPALGRLTAAGMVQGLHAPLHPGAERYFREAGLLPAAP